MKHINFAALLFCIAYGTTSAMENHTLSIIDKVLLPSAATLHQRLQEIPQCNDFLQKSSLIALLADQYESASNVCELVNLAKNTYKQECKNNKHIDKSMFEIEMYKHRIVAAILHDHPQAIEALKKENIIDEPIKLGSQETLAKLLDGKDHCFIVENCNLIEELADQIKYPTEILMTIVGQIANMANLKTSNPCMITILLASVPSIARIILSGHKHSLEWLEQEFITK